jgi:DNA repair protein RadC
MAELVGILLKENPESAAVKGITQELQNNKHLLEFEIEELIGIKGVGSAKARQLMAAIEIGKRIINRPKENRINVSSPKAVAALFMGDLRYKQKEYFQVLLLDTKNSIIAIEEVSVGTLNTTIVHNREVFNLAIRRHASSIICVHNHPSSVVQPSREDIDLTLRLVEAGKIIGIEVLDHIIIGGNDYLSFKEKSLF